MPSPQKGSGPAVVSGPVGPQKVSLEEFYARMQEGETQELKLIVKGDVQGSVEALSQALNKLSTKDVKVIKKYPHDPQVNRICSDTVSKWRFKPKIVGGKPIETCSKVTFDIRFE